jgi:hypothetical protein
MKRSTLAIAVLALGVPISAQAKTVTSPSGFENKEAPAFAYYFAMHANGRQQFADGMQKGKGTKLISKVSYRLDYRNHTTSTGAGKSWANVQLRISDCNFATMSNVFAANPTSTPTLVYNSAVTWPAQSGSPSTNPAPWSASRAFPFSTPWFYVATSDILLDYQFNGGKLANAAPWSGNSARLMPYHDANSSYDYASWTLTYLGTQNCVDSGQTVGAYTYFTGYTYPKSAGTTHDGQVYSWITAYNVGFNVNVVVAIGLKGTAGTTFPGVTCNKLFLDATAPWILLFGKTTATASWYFNSFGYPPFNPAMVNLNLWGQTAWNDSVTGMLKLSRAARTVVQNQPPNPPPKKMIYASSPTATVYGPFFSSSRNPLILYTC